MGKSIYKFTSDDIANLAEKRGISKREAHQILKADSIINAISTAENLDDIKQPLIELINYLRG